MERRFARMISFLTGFALFALYAPAFLMMLGSCSDTSDTFPIFGSGGQGGIVITTPDAGTCPETATASSGSVATDASASSSSSSSSSSGEPAKNPCDCADKWQLDPCGEDGLGNCYHSDAMQSPVFSCWYRCIDKNTGQPAAYNSCPNPCISQLGGAKTYDPWP